MSKRIMSLLLCLTLVMTPAFNTYALEVDDAELLETVDSHEHQYEYANNGDGTHDGVCSVENCYYSIKNEGHDFLDGECSKCGAKEEVEIVDETELVILNNGDEFNDENGEKKDELDEIGEIYPAFDQSAAVNGVVVTVTASEGVFPSDAQLSVKRVSRSDREFAEGAVEDVRDEDMVVAVSYTFDIKVLDSDGNEIQPTDDQRVTVSFSTVEVADSNLETDVYHISDDGEAKKLVTETNDDEVSAETDGFSYYTVEFTYHELQYVMEGDSTINLNEILNTIGLEGEVSNVECSNEDLFSVSKDGNDWTVTAHQTFTGEEWMSVTINNVEYAIKVTDSPILHNSDIITRSPINYTSSNDIHIRDVLLGYVTSAAVDTDNNLWTWGSNQSGSQIGVIGIGEKEESTIPELILDNVRIIRVSNSNGAAIDYDGNLWMWGGDYWGNMGNGEGGSDCTVPIKIMENVKEIEIANTRCAAIDHNGGLWMWGSSITGPYNNENFPIKMMDNVKKIAMGGGHCAAIDYNGGLWMWGSNSRGQLGIGTDGLNSRSYSFIKIMDNIQEVDLSDASSCAIDNDRNLWAWGSNEHGQIGVEGLERSTVPVKIMENVKNVWLGDDTSYAIDSDDNLWTWGGDAHAVDYHSSTKTKVLENVKEFDFCSSNCAAIDNDGKLWMWGKNDYGSLGNGTRNDSSEPVMIMENVQKVSLGGTHSGAIDNDGHLWMWGMNVYGALGDGITEHSYISLVPKRIFYSEIQKTDYMGDFSYYSTISNVDHFSNNADDYKRDYTYRYSDDWFWDNSHNYNHDLARMSLRTAMAAMDFGDGSTGNRKSDNIKKLMEDLDFNSIRITYPNPDTNSIGTAMGYKTIEKDGMESTLILVAIRGGGYEKEWGGNFNVRGTINSSSDVLRDHAGFNMAAAQVLERLNEYLGDDFAGGIKDDLRAQVKVWFVGYSRAAATANIAAARVIDGIEGNERFGNIKDAYIDTSKNVFAYCFECPQNTEIAKDNNPHDDMYSCIFNIVNPLDFVPKVAMSNNLSWNYTRYGTTYTLPSSLANLDYDALNMDMVDVYLNELKIPSIPHEYPFEEWLYQELINRLADITISPDVYAAGITVIPDIYINFQDSLVSIGRETLGSVKLEETTDEIQAFFERVFDSIGYKLSLYPKLKSKLAELGEDAKFPHYPELCLAWMDSIDERDLKEPKYTRFGYLNCPVDVTIKDKNNKVVGRIVNDIPEEIEDGIFTIVDDDGQKVFAMPGDGDYSIEFTATGNGKMTYSVVEQREGFDTVGRVVSYADVLITKGDSLTGTASETVDRDAVYTLSKVGNEIQPTINQTGDSIERYTVNVEAVGKGTALGNGVYTYGQFDKLEAIPDEGEQFICWDVAGNVVSTDADHRIEVVEDTNVMGIFTDSTSETYYVGFDTQGAKEITSIKNVAKGSTINLPTIVWGNHEFLGWYTEPEGKGDKFTSESVVNNNMVLYANWMTLEVPVNSVSFDITSRTIKVGESFAITPAINPANATDKTLSWESSDVAVATVVNGKVTANGVGTAVIKATSTNGKSTTCNVTVKRSSTPIPITPTTTPTPKPTTTQVPRPTTKPEKKDSGSGNSSTSSLSSSSSSSGSGSSAGSSSMQTSTNSNAIAVTSFVPSTSGAGKIVGDVRISVQEQGPIAKFLFKLFTPAGWKEAFTFNLTVNGSQDYTLKKGKLNFYIPPTYRKQGRTFALISIVKPGQIKYFLDTDKNPETITVDLDCEGYAFDLIYFDLPTAVTKK